MTGQSIEIPNIKPLLDDEGRFLSNPLEMRETELLGMTIGESRERLPEPSRMFSIRGAADWQDDVVFFYADYSYQYWYKDRVWQIRYDYRYEGEIAGVRMGMTVDEATEILSAPHFTGTSSIYYNLADRGYPARMRLYFDDGILHDVYIYRSDF